MFSLKKTFFVFSLLCFVPLLSGHATAQMSGNGPDGKKLLNLARGTLSLPNPDAGVLRADLVCDYVEAKLIAPSCYGVDKIVVDPVTGISDLVILSASNSGFVEFHDWRPTTSPALIAQIEESLDRQVKESCGDKNCAFSKWVVPPTLVKKKQYLIFSYNIAAEGKVINQAQVIQYDRKGFVVFDVTLANAVAPQDQQTVLHLLSMVGDMYQPEEDERYAIFTYREKMPFTNMTNMLREYFVLPYTSPMDQVEEGYFLAGCVAVVLLSLIILLIFLPGAKSEDARQGRQKV